MASFRKRGEKWEYRIKYTDIQTGKPKEKSKGGFRTKKEAQIEAAEVEKKLYLGQHSVIESRELLIKDWLEEWFNVYGFQCEESTRKNRFLILNKHIIPAIGNYKLSQLTKTEYQKYINRLSENYTKKTVQTFHSIFCTAVNKAVELEMLTHNKFNGIRIKSKENEVMDNYLNREEVTTFIKAAKEGHFHHYMVALILLRTGIRKGELIALTWDDVNLEEATMSITKSRSKLGTKLPKTSSSVRTIKIDSVLVEELKKMKLWQKKNKLKKGMEYIETNYIITAPNGKPIGECGINAIVNTILKKTDLHHISPHGLRHTHAIMLLESGVDIKMVSERLGHTTIDMTANVYIHITKKHEEESVKRFEKYLS